MPTVGGAARKPPRCANDGLAGRDLDGLDGARHRPSESNLTRPTEKALDSRLTGHAAFERARQLADEPLAWDSHLPGNA